LYRLSRERHAGQRLGIELEKPLVVG